MDRECDYVELLGSISHVVHRSHTHAQLSMITTDLIAKVAQERWRYHVLGMTSFGVQGLEFRFPLVLVLHLWPGLLDARTSVRLRTEASNTTAVQIVFRVRMDLRKAPTSSSRPEHLLLLLSKAFCLASGFFVLLFE